jgi:polypeptide N-acetylgalactosaminyltransferase
LALLKTGKKNFCFILTINFKIRKILAVPIVDGLDWNSLEHTNIYGNSLNRGIFEWGFLYKETEVPSEESKRHPYRTEPYW